MNEVTLELPCPDVLTGGTWYKHMYYCTLYSVLCIQVRLLACATTTLE